jgi:hypothetical protein
MKKTILVLILTITSVLTWSQESKGIFTLDNWLEIEDPSGEFSIGPMYVTGVISWKAWTLMQEPVYDVRVALILPDRMEVGCSGQSFYLPTKVIEKIRAVDISVSGAIKSNETYASRAMVEWDSGSPGKSFVGSYSQLKSLAKESQRKYFSYNTPSSPSWDEMFYSGTSKSSYLSSKEAKAFFLGGFEMLPSTGCPNNCYESYLGIEWDVSAVRDYLENQGCLEDDGDDDEDFMDGGDDDEEDDFMNDDGSGQDDDPLDKIIEEVEGVGRVSSVADRYLGSMTVQGDKVTMHAWDHGSEDGDKVSIYVNGVAVESYMYLRKNKKFITLDLREGENEIQVVAKSEGSRPPNTASFIVKDLKGKES